MKDKPSLLLIMANRTIYVSDQDEPIFEEAKTVAGEGLSSVISKALKEFVTKHRELGKGMKEIKVKVGPSAARREQFFIGSEVGKWSGFSDDKKSWMEAKIYQTQKGNFAVYLVNVCDASLITNPGKWEPLSHFDDAREAKLLVSPDSVQLKSDLPKSLYSALENLIKKNDAPVEYLDI